MQHHVPSHPSCRPSCLSSVLLPSLLCKSERGRSDSHPTMPIRVFTLASTIYHFSFSVTACLTPLPCQFGCGRPCSASTMSPNANAQPPPPPCFSLRQCSRPASTAPTSSLVYHLYQHVNLSINARVSFHHVSV